MAATRPRIHWVSPLPPAETDIAHYTARLLPDLATRAEVVLWTDAEAWDPALEHHATVRRFDPEAHLPLDMRKLGPVGDAPEAVFLNIGNSWLYHGKILRLGLRVPGVAVLHDLALQDLCKGMLDKGLMSREHYRAEMALWYGPEGARAASDMIAGRRGPRELISAMPGFEVTLGRAIAAIAHSGPGFDTVAARGHVPVYRFDLPYPPGPAPAPERAPEGPLRLVQFGHLQPNRRLDEILATLAAIRDRVDFRFDLYGSLWDPGHIDRRIAALGLGDRVTRHGFADEAALDRAIGAAHLVFNLRYPTMGEASGSQLRVWNAAAASVVSDHGWYATLPDEMVFKVPPTDEEAALGALLMRLDRERGLGASLGRAGRSHLEAHHSTALYAEQLVAVAAETSANAQAALTAERARSLLADAARPDIVKPGLAALI